MSNSTKSEKFLDGNIAKLGDGKVREKIFVHGVDQPFPILLTFGFFNQEEFLISMCETIFADDKARQVWIQEGEIL